MTFATRGLVSSAGAEFETEMMPINNSYRSEIPVTSFSNPNPLN